MRLFTLLPILMIIPMQVFAQPEHLRILHQATMDRITEAAKRCPGVVGMAAIDLKGDDGFSLNDTLVFPQASAIKVTLLMEVYKQAHGGKFKLTDRVTINNAQTVEGGILNTFADGGSQISIHDLCVLMVVLSDNSATNMLIDKVGMSNVNASLQALGFKATRLQRKMMDIKASERGEENISTPLEAARLMRLLGSGEFVDRETSEAILFLLRLPRDVPGNIPAALPADLSVAFKKGEILPAVLTEWALVGLKGHPYVIVIMSNYGTETDSAPAFREISKAVYDYYWRVARSSPHGTYMDPSLWK